MRKIFLTILIFAVMTMTQVFANEAYSAAARGDFGVMIRIAKETPEQLREKDAHGWTPLHYAVYADNFWASRWLIIQGTDINTREERGRTPLFLAVEKGNTKMVNLLLENKPVVDEADNIGNTPLHQAACKTDTEMIVILLKNGAKIDHKNKEGKTPLITAIDYQNTDMVKFLIDQGADFQVKDIRGKTPLFHALGNGNIEIIGLLKEKGANIDEKEINKAKLEGCYSNLKNIATALEMYYQDYKKYPDTLSALVPSYLKKIPECPAAGKDVYSGSYRLIDNGKDYMMFCTGDNHHGSGMKANFPQYTGDKGIIQH
jgi:hypothetical protein